ncbi:MAG TPA: nicotinate phosphoribosyltransferase [Bryobacteraceae bacterium]|nr:nicotinate phosphoribosyltransferase [Bryobacteraceae bacterium]
MNGLLTDLYELTMAAGYFAAGRPAGPAVFELSVRRLPKNRDYILIAGLEQALEYLLHLRFTAEEVDYLRALPQFARVSPAFFDYLREFRFTGDVHAVPEGTILYAGEPVLTIRAPLIQAQIPETYLLSTLTFQTLIATKAARVTQAAAGRGVVEFGTRRAHTPQAGVLGARAAYIGGCIGTSNTQAGFRFGIPVMGTCAHSWVMSYPTEREAFRRLQELLGPYTIQLVDTYEPVEGVRRAAALGPPLWGIRLDSGDFDSLSRQARAILDQAGLGGAKIMASGDLDEYRIAALVAAGAPIDSFGVGTELATSGDAPSMGAIYKLVEVEGRPVAKWSEDKASLPGAKQLFRLPDRDILALASESCPPGAEALLQPVIVYGQRTAPPPPLTEIRGRAARSLGGVQPRPMLLSDPLKALAECLREERK